jgi:hypothetical protein
VLREPLAVRAKAHERKDRGDLELLDQAARTVAHSQGAHRVIAEDLLDDGAVPNFDCRLLGDAPAVGRLSVELLAAVEDHHSSSGLGERQRLLERRVAAADDRRGLPSQERPVAARAGADAVTLETLLTRDPERPEAGTGRDDHCAAARFALVGRQRPAAVRRLQPFELRTDDLGARRVGLRLHDRAELVAGDAVRVAGKALDPVDGEQQSAREDAGQNEHAPPEPSGGESGIQPGEPAAGDDDVVVVTHAGSLAI